MSQGLRPISQRDLVKAFRRLGWDGPWQGSKHQFMHKGRRKVRVPNPHRGDISRQLVATILEQAGVSREEWLEATR